MDGYEQMLEIDRITVEYGVSEEELMQLMASAKGESPEPSRLVALDHVGVTLGIQYFENDN